jgi:Uncharacterised nucleotidyltransferase
MVDVTDVPIQPAAAWEAVTALGRLEPDEGAIGRAVQALPERDGVVPALVERLRIAQVRELALRNLDVVDTGSSLQEPLRRAVEEEVEAKRRIVERVFPIGVEVVRRGAAAGAHLLKGLAMRTYYPEPHLRRVGDVDLHFDDFETALPFLRELRGEGWEWDANELPWLKWDDAGRPYGQWAITLELKDEDIVYRIDTHIGAYSVGHLGLLPLERFEPIDFEGTTIGAPEPEAALGLIAAHATGDYLLSMKDINDVGVLARRPVEWRRARELARTAGAEPALGQIVWWADHLYGLEGAAEVATEPDRPLPKVRPHPRARALATAKLTVVQERRSGAPVNGLVRLPGALAAYMRDLSPRIGTTWPTRPSQRYRRRWLCWRMVPESVWSGFRDGTASQTPVAKESLGAGLELVSTDDAAVVRLEDDVFIPTVWGPLSPKAVALARRVAARA